VNILGKIKKKPDVEIEMTTKEK